MRDDISIFGLFMVLMYFAPSIIADYRKHPNWRAIVALNILLGWTFIGWVAALVWAMTAFNTPRSARGATGIY